MDITQHVLGLCARLYQQPASPGHPVRRDLSPEERFHLWNLRHVPGTGCTHHFTANPTAEQVTAFILQRLFYWQNSQHNCVGANGDNLPQAKPCYSPQNLTSNYFIGASMVIIYSKPCQIKQLGPCHTKNREYLPKTCTEDSEQTRSL